MQEIAIGRLRGGYCVYWTDDGKRRRYQLKARTRAEAESEARDVYLKEKRPVVGLNVSQIWEAYRLHLGKKKTAETMSWTGKAVLKSFGTLRPDQITIDDCRNYLADRTADGRKIGTVHTELGHLRSALKWAHKTGHIDRVPHIELPPKPDNDVRPLSDGDVQKIIDGCSAFHVRLAVILLLTTGARVGAILDRTWDKIDFQRGVIDLRERDGVTRKGRAVVPMNRMSRAALQTAHSARQTEWVVEYNGKNVGSIKTGYSNALRRAGLSGINIHQIRHTVAVKMLAAGQPIEAVSQYLGHSNIQITQKIYARFMPEHLADAAAVLEFDRFNEPQRTSQK